MKTQIQATKRIDWSCATSEYAKKFGFYKTGCYTFESVSDGLAVPLRGFETYAEARAHAENNSMPWDKRTK